MKLKTEYRFPMFFVGVMMMALSGFAGRYIMHTETYVPYLVIVGFLVAVLSVAFP